MVASIPLAIEIVTTTTLALGSKELTNDGAIVTRLAAIEDMAGMAILCCDKTGTLTMNKMMIQDETPVYKEDIDQYQLLRYAAMAAKWKEPPRDALDTLVLGQADLRSLDTVEQLEYMPFDAIVKRTEGTIREKLTGKQYKITKGAPHVIIKLISETGFADPVNVKKIETDINSFSVRGIRCLAVAKTNDEGHWEMLGLLTFLDPPRPDTKQTIQDAHSFGVAVKMLTGDNLLIACETARQLGMGAYIKPATGLPMLDPVTKKKPKNLARDYGTACLAADGFAQVYPEHKYLIVECLRELGYKIGMTGDGVNDAPALKRADVGVAVLGCTDAARAAADIVLTREGLSTIVKGIVVSRKIFIRIRNFIVYRISATLQLLVFFFIAVLAFRPSEYMPSNWQTNPNFPDKHPWPEYFHMPVIMLMLITLLNDGTLIAIGYDNVVPRQDPERWNLQALFAISCLLAGVALISSLILLDIMLKSWEATGGNQGLSYGQITTSIYLKVSISDFLTLLSVRTGDNYFWTSKPAPILMAAALLALSLSTILACSWPSSYPDSVYSLGLAYREPKAMAFYVWIYCLAWWLVQDILKVGFYALMKKYNWFGWNNTGKIVMSDTVQKYINDNMNQDMESNVTSPIHG
jgi:H+-transporting ATPase